MGPPNQPMVVESRRFLPMDGMRPDVLPQRNTTIRGCSGTRSGAFAADFLYAGAAHRHAPEFFENQRSVFLAGKTAND